MVMPIVIDLKEEIKKYLKGQGCDPMGQYNNTLTDDDLHKAICHGAAKCYKKWIGVDMAKDGYCWSNNEVKSLKDRILDAVSELEGEMGVYNNTNQDNWTLIWSYINQD